MDLKKLRENMKWLDPFTYVDLYVMPTVNPKESEAISWIVYLLSAFVFAWLIYTGLGVLLGTESPMMIVVSSSMQPLYGRGDIILLQGAKAELLDGIEVEVQLPSLSETEFAAFAKPVYASNQSKTIEAILFDSGQKIPITKQGSVVVYWSEHMSEPIVHRVVAKLKAADGWYILTKGDSLNNTTIDQDCGLIINGRPEKQCIEFYPVPLEKLQGKAFFHVPLLGCVKLWLLDDLGSLLATGKLPKEFQPGNIC